MNTTDLKFDPQRLTALAAIARKAAAARSGLNDATHELRDARRELQGRLDRAKILAANSGRHSEKDDTEIRKLEAELADLKSDIAVMEVETDEAAEAASAARANLTAALKFAKAEGIAIPSALADEAANV